MVALGGRDLVTDLELREALVHKQHVGNSEDITCSQMNSNVRFDQVAQVMKHGIGNQHFPAFVEIDFFIYFIFLEKLWAPGRKQNYRVERKSLPIPTYLKEIKKKQEELGQV
jgi:hypothetical protein